MPTPDDEPAAFDTRDARRVARQARRGERFDRGRYNGSGRVPFRSDPKQRVGWPVRITGSPSEGTPGMWPAVVLEFAGITDGEGVWEDGEECWVVPYPGGSKLRPGPAHAEPVDVYDEDEKLILAALPTGPEKWVTDVCPVKDGYGAFVGLALFEQYADGHGECRVVDFCEDCGSADVPVSPPPPPPPPPPPTPPDPPPDTYDVFVVVYENDPDPVTGLCTGGTTVGGYTVAVSDSTEASQVVPAGGIWFTGIPWGTDSSATISGTSGPVFWNVTSVGCGGAGSYGATLSAPIDGDSCDNVAVTFALGLCGAVPGPVSTEEISVAKPTEEIEEPPP